MKSLLIMMALAVAGYFAWQKLARAPFGKTRAKPVRVANCSPRAARMSCHRGTRLFDDESILSTYLSLTAGAATERDGRLVVYGLTDKEGALVCEQMRKVNLEKYTGTAHCVAASVG